MDTCCENRNMIPSWSWSDVYPIPLAPSRPSAPSQVMVPELVFFFFFFFFFFSFFFFFFFFSLLSFFFSSSLSLLPSPPLFSFPSSPSLTPWPICCPHPLPLRSFFHHHSGSLLSPSFHND